MPMHIVVETMNVSLGGHDVVVLLLAFALMRNLSTRLKPKK